MNEFHSVSVISRMRRTANPWRLSGTRFNSRSSQMHDANPLRVIIYIFGVHGSAWVCVICFDLLHQLFLCPFINCISRATRHAFNSFHFTGCFVWIRRTGPYLLSLNAFFRFSFPNTIVRHLLAVTAWAPNDKGLLRYHLLLHSTYRIGIKYFNRWIHKVFIDAAKFQFPIHVPTERYGRISSMHSTLRGI